MTSTEIPKPIDQETYWNEEGGARWVAYIEHIETLLAGLSERLLAGVAAVPGQRVLDLGCGGGITSAALARAVGASGEVLGVDISAVILAVARERYASVRNLRFERADAGSHGFELGSFDLVTSRFGVMFFHDPVAAFANIRKAARPGARLVFLCWRGLDQNPWMGVPATAAFAVTGPPPKPDPEAPGPFSFARPERVHRILEAAGFGDVEMQPIDTPLNLGAVDQAVEWLTRMGPAAAPLEEAAADTRAAAVAAMREVLAAHATPRGTIMDSGTWLVTAANPGDRDH